MTVMTSSSTREWLSVSLWSTVRTFLLLACQYQLLINGPVAMMPGASAWGRRYNISICCCMLFSKWILHCTWMSELPWNLLLMIWMSVRDCLLFLPEEHCSVIGLLLFLVFLYQGTVCLVFICLGGVWYPYFILENQEVFLNKVEDDSKTWKILFLLFSGVFSFQRKPMFFDLLWEKNLHLFFLIISFEEMW